MRWKTPDFEEINLSGEVTSYANSDDQVRASERHPVRNESKAADSDKTQEASA